MSRRTFSLRGLLIGVALAGLATAAWIGANAWWSSAVFTAALVAMLTAAVAAIAGQGETRCRWLGCLVFGAGYLWLSHSPGPDRIFVNAWEVQQEGPLWTSKLNQWLYIHAFGRIRPAPSPPNPAATMGGGMPAGMGGPGMGGSNGTFFLAISPPTGSAAAYPSLEDFAQISHSLYSLLLAWAGYALGGFLYRRYRPPAS